MGVGIGKGGFTVPSSVLCVMGLFFFLKELGSVRC